MNRIKKFKPIVLKVLQGVLIVFTVYMMIFTIVSIKNVNNDAGKGFLGFKMFVVLSDSMKPEFQAGDIILTRVVDDPSKLEIGDTITFYSSSGRIVTHEIQEKVVHESEDAFITKGINVDQADEDPALVKNVIGKYSFAIPKAGFLFQFIKTKTGYVTMVLIPFLIVITLNGSKLLKVYKEYKNEQRKVIELKNKELELENQKMLEELKKLKEQLNMGNNG